MPYGCIFRHNITLHCAEHKIYTKSSNPISSTWTKHIPSNRASHIDKLYLKPEHMDMCALALPNSLNVLQERLHVRRYFKGNNKTSGSPRTDKKKRTHYIRTLNFFVMHGAGGFREENIFHKSHTHWQNGFSCSYSSRLLAYIVLQLLYEYVCILPFTKWLIITVEWLWRHKKWDDKCMPGSFSPCRKSDAHSMTCYTGFHKSEWLHSFGCNKHLILRRRFVVDGNVMTCTTAVGRQARVVFGAFYFR